MTLPFRIGIGYDIHRLGPDRPLIMGGITIPHTQGLIGHSDADVLSHAIADAILGALALPDIGHYFPPSDPQWKDMDSLLILQKAVQLAHEHQYSIGNIDATIIAEQPKFRPHVDVMKAKLADTLSLQMNQVGLKATTNETLDATGEERGIAVHAVALLVAKA